MAVFALWAFFAALLVYFNGYVNDYGKEIVTDVSLRAMISVGIAILLTFFFWLLSPLMIKNLIDSQKPFGGDKREIYILLGGYFILIPGNFLLVPVGFSLVSFIILTVIFVGLYSLLSEKPYIFKKGL